MTVQGADVVQVSLIDAASLSLPRPAKAPRPREEEPETLVPEEEEGVRVAKPAKQPPQQKPKQEEEPESAPPDAPAVPAAALPYAPAGAPGLRAQVSVNADFAFTYYLLALRNRIAQNWAAPAGLNAGGRPVRATVQFRIARGGRLSAPRLEAASGFEYFDRSALRAIQLSDPMPPLPDGYAGSDLSVLFDFEFTAP